jgi:hypothetical protein
MIDVSGNRTEALCDSGANPSCMTEEMFNKLTYLAPLHTTLTKIKTPVRMVLARGETSSVPTVLGLRLKISEGLTVFSHFLVISELKESIILGNNFFHYYRAQLNFNDDSTLMKLPNIRKIGITVIKRSENYDPPPEFY